MTALTAIERLPPDTAITVSALAASQPASKISMKPGERWKFSDALASLMVVSANDAAYAIAESTSGNVAAFAKAEAETGRQLGLRDSTFADPAGLDDGNAFRGGPLMSAYDIAVSTRNALRTSCAITRGPPSVSFTGPDGVQHTLVNHNRLVADGLYRGANGFKTGFTNKAQHTLVATASAGIAPSSSSSSAPTTPTGGQPGCSMSVSTNDAAGTKTGQTPHFARLRPMRRAPCSSRRCVVSRAGRRQRRPVRATRNHRRHRAPCLRPLPARGWPRRTRPRSPRPRRPQRRRKPAEGRRSLGHDDRDPDRRTAAGDAVRIAGAGGTPRPRPASGPAAGDQQHDATRRAPRRRRPLPDGHPRRETGRVTRPAASRPGTRRRQRLWIRL